MDKLFAAQATRLHEEQATRDRVQCKDMIERYNERIKRDILHLYQVKGPAIARLIQIVQLTRNCTNLATLESLKAETSAINAECEAFCGDVLKHRQLVIFNNWNGQRKMTFPDGWEIDVVQEWCDYWQSGMLFGESKRSKERDKLTLEQLIAKTKESKVQVIAHWCEYKSREIHVDIWKTVTECSAWRERYDLQHLDVLVTYLK